MCFTLSSNASQLFEITHSVTYSREILSPSFLGCLLLLVLVSHSALVTVGDFFFFLTGQFLASCFMLLGNLFV